MVKVGENFYEKIKPCRNNIGDKRIQILHGKSIHLNSHRFNNLIKSIPLRYKFYMAKLWV